MEKGQFILHVPASDIQYMAEWIVNVRRWEGSGLAVFIHGEWREYWATIPGKDQTYLFPMQW